MSKLGLCVKDRDTCVIFVNIANFFSFGLGIVGPLTSSQALVLSPLLSHYKIIQISIMATIDALSNKIEVSQNGYSKNICTKIHGSIIKLALIATI